MSVQWCLEAFLANVRKVNSPWRLGADLTWQFFFEREEMAAEIDTEDW